VGLWIVPSRPIHLGKFYSETVSPSWRGIILKIKKRSAEGVPSAGLTMGCAEKLHEPSQLCQRLLKACLRPSFAGHYLSLETVPTTA
jgi:hypothetical protein